MRFKLGSSARFFVAAACVLFALNTIAAPAKDYRFEAILVWATTAETSPDPDHKPLESAVRKKLSELPLKWKNYFEVKREKLPVQKGGSKEISLSKQCKIAVRDIDGRNFEVSLFGKGESVLKRIQKLPEGDMLVLGGNAPDSTAWLVVLKRID